MQQQGEGAQFGIAGGEESPCPLPTGATRSELPPLTRREREVLTLLRDRLTDREIAASLSIGLRTAESHVASVRAKLGMARRYDATLITL